MNSFLRASYRKIVPFALRVRLQQTKRHLHWRLHPLPWATQHADPADFPCIIDERSSPLHRVTAGSQGLTSEGKEKNIALGSAAIDGIVIAPGEVFSFCRVIGPTTCKRGYVPGLEMHDQELTRSPGGGLCQLANLLFAMAVHADAEIVERHRHSFDLFPDADRTVPFGFGATVFYNHVDFQFRNTLDQPLMLHTWVEDERLHGQVRLPQCPGWRMRVVETGHRFYRENGLIYRENQLWKQRVLIDGIEQARAPLFSTKAQVLYPADHLIDPTSS
jgi:vancomycin resistance protein VanW